SLLAGLFQDTGLLGAAYHGVKTWLDCFGVRHALAVKLAVQYGGKFEHFFCWNALLQLLQKLLFAWREATLFQGTLALCFSISVNNTIEIMFFFFVGARFNCGIFF